MSDKPDRPDGDELLRLADKIGKDIACTRTYSMNEWAIIEAALRRAPTRDGAEGAEDAEWCRQAKATLEHLGGFLQKTGAPHRVDWREWIDSADKHLGLKWPNEAQPAAPPKPAHDAMREALTIMERTEVAYINLLVNQYKDNPEMKMHRNRYETLLAIIHRLSALVPSPNGAVNPCPICGINNNSPFPCEHAFPSPTRAAEPIQNPRNQDWD